MFAGFFRGSLVFFDDSAAWSMFNLWGAAAFVALSFGGPRARIVAAIFFGIQTASMGLILIGSPLRTGWGDLEAFSLAAAGCLVAFAAFNYIRITLGGTDDGG